MRDYGNAIARLNAFRAKFGSLVEAARKRAGSTARPRARGAPHLHELKGFGSNPGNLRMFVYVPRRLRRGAPLVVALHACDQTAEEYDRGTGWSSLADRHGFAIVFPQQQPANNPKNCFSWFLPGDIARDHGEALSIRQMIGHALIKYGVNRRGIYVTGFSAGGAMAAVMLAAYPDVFAGGAILAGLPYGTARTVEQAFEAMFTERSFAAPALGEHVRAASRHDGPWPRISVWHGTADPIVKPSNGEDIIRQWANVHGLPDVPSREERIDCHTRRVWNDTRGNILIEAYSISGMAHGAPLSSNAHDECCGEAGAFFLDAGISSTHHIARFWRLHEAVPAQHWLAPLPLLKAR
jgi:poly(hydroxyalkanoate) depolymerase family esterase